MGVVAFVLRHSPTALWSSQGPNMTLEYFISSDKKGGRRAISCVALLCSANIILFFLFFLFFSYAVGSPNRSQMMSRTRSLSRPLRRRQQERAGRCLSILPGRRRAASEGRRSSTPSLARRRSSREKPVGGQSRSLSSWKSAWRSCTDMAGIVFSMKEGRSRRGRNGSSGAICV